MAFSRTVLFPLSAGTLLALLGCFDPPAVEIADAGDPPGVAADAGDETPPLPDGGHDDGGMDAGLPEPDAGTPVDAPPECPEVTEGLNVIQLGNTERRFWVNSPAADVASPAAVFWFHGFSGPRSPHEDALSDSLMLDGLGLHPDADPTFPFVRVLLEDTNLQPLSGLDWDIRTDDPNRDLALFDVVVQCIRAHRGVPEDRIFAAGFSAGATFANLLHTARPGVVRAVYTASGLWVNEPLNLQLAHRVTFGIPLVNWSWPELSPVEPAAAAVLVTHGGPADNVPGNPNPLPSNLTEAGRAAVGMLLDRGRLVIECEHTTGHRLHPEVSGQFILDFFAAHVGTGPSPWLTAEPPLPPSCVLRRP